MRISVAVLLAAFALHAYADDRELTLTQRSSAETIVSIERIVRTDTGFAAVIESSLGEIDRLVMDRNRSTLEWRRTYAREGTEIVAVRQGRMVQVTGTLKNKPVSLQKDFGDLPWYQFQELSYPALVASSARKSEFWTIGRSDLRFTHFYAEFETTERIRSLGSEAEALKYRITVNGIPAVLFSSRFWLRTNDGTFLRLEVPPVLGNSAITVELTDEQPYQRE